MITENTEPLTDNRTGERQKAVLVSVMLPQMTEQEIDTSLDELERLLDTAGGDTALRVVQARQAPDNKTFIGKGKAEEIKQIRILHYDSHHAIPQIVHRIYGLCSALGTLIFGNHKIASNF